MKKRVDAQKNKAKIVKQVLKKPLSTQRELAKKAGVSKTTVQQHIKELNMTKDDRIIDLCDKDIEIVKKTIELSEYFLNWLVEWINDSISKWEKVTVERDDVEQARKISETSTKRYTIFRGDITDEQWGMKGAIDLDKIKEAL